MQHPGGRDAGRTNYYADDSGKIPYQFYHPRVDGYWPMHRYRLLWTWFFDAWRKLRPISRHARFQNPAEWEGQRLPGMARNNHHTHMYTRWAVPVDANLTRATYFFSTRPKNALGRLYDRLCFKLILNWMYFYNFSDQDYDAMRSCRYQHPEYLSATDSVVVALRRLVGDEARGAEHRIEVVEETTAERLVEEASRLLGVAAGYETEKT